MSESTAVLARSITWKSSKQTYYTACLMVDNDLKDDFFRAYAYFRWMDDIIDEPGLSQNKRISFVKRQRKLIESFYRKKRITPLNPEEKILRDLIQNDRGRTTGLQSFIRNMFAIIEFDAKRKGRVVSDKDLKWYVKSLGRSVIDGLQYFIGNGHPYPDTDTTDRYYSAEAAHITHLLRDMVEDTANGFINIPREYIKKHKIDPKKIIDHDIRDWVRGQVDLARKFFKEGKMYIDRLDVLRCRIVGHWYCARFESILKLIEKDNYILRPKYNEYRNLFAWLKVGWLGASVTFKYYIGKILHIYY
ncbi:MAG: squalene/phytoene synthase family protein [Spirochaetes bacterium]|nr:squalene/phytoene synthase family protein [Spirochaetota bacterium]